MSKKHHKSEEKPVSNIRNLLKTMGPGILLAGAAIGVSHLVQATRAGANYGFALMWLMIATIVLKYPFFEFAQRYTGATGESLLEGYRRVGKGTLYSFLVLAILVSVPTYAVVTMVTAGLACHMICKGLSIGVWSAIIMLFCILVLLAGHYKWLDRVMKFKVILLSIATVIAFIAACCHGRNVIPEFSHTSPWTLAALPFLIALMGWMPGPIDISVWPSLWMLEREKETHHKPTVKEALIDFYTGYGATLILAVAFLGLGAMVMYGSGEKMSPKGAVFASQFVHMYEISLGPWLGFLIAIAAFATMLSTTLAVVDAYPRTISACFGLSFKPMRHKMKGMYWIIMLILAVLSLTIIFWFIGSMMTLVTFATILSFLAAPFFAFINYRVITSKHMPKKHRPPVWLRALSWTGIVFLAGFSLVYIYYLSVKFTGQNSEKKPEKTLTIQGEQNAKKGLGKVRSAD